MKKSFLHYLKGLFGKKQEPNSERKRELLEDIGLNFYDWAQEFFNREKLNSLITIKSIIDDYNDNPYVNKHIPTFALKTKLKKYCELKGFKMNPEEYINCSSSRIIYKDSSSGAAVEYVFIKTH